MWPLGPEWDDDRLEAAFFGGPPRSRPTVLPVPDYAELHRERQQHPHLTQQLLWEEYRQANPDGYRSSRFCELYQRWRPQTERSVASGTQGRREAIRGLRGHNDPDP